MLDTNLKKEWTRWYPEKIFLKSINNKQKFLLHKNDFRKQDVDININNNEKICNNNIIIKEKEDILKKEAYKIGFQEGLLRDKEKNIMLCSQINKLLLDFQNSLSTFENVLFDRLLKIIFIAASYIIGKKINVKDESILLEHITQIIEKESFFLKKQKLLIHPDNKALIKKIFKDSLNSFRWELIYDDRLDINSCKLKSENNDLDATIDARWQELRRVIHSEVY